jgi:hypothetical protein
MKVYVWGSRDPEDFASKKMDGKWRNRYVDYKMSPKSESSFRIKVRSYNGMYGFYPVKRRKSHNQTNRKDQL